MTNTKLDIELKGLRVTYEGPSDFLENGLVDICKKLSELNLPEMAVGAAPGPAKPDSLGLKMSTTDIAVKLSSKSGPDLVMAAAAHLRLVKGQEDFKRGDILAEMKSAKSFYKQTYSNNLSKSLDGLVKGRRLSNPGTDTYALPHSEEENLRRQLGF